ncbi:hypothetical protein STEG23_000192 [Scotinomys teguina]
MAPGWPRPLRQILVLGLGLVLMRAAAGEQAPGSVFQVGKVSVHSKFYPQSETQFRYLSNQGFIEYPLSRYSGKDRIPLGVTGL